MSNEQYIQYYELNLPWLVKDVKSLKEKVTVDKKYNLLSKYYNRKRLLNWMQLKLKERRDG